MPISFSKPYKRAWLRLKSALFGPLDLGRWFVLGFTAWLAQMDSYPGLNFRLNFDLPVQTKGLPFHGLPWALPVDFGFPHWSLPLIVTIACGVLLIGLAMLWIQSRGKFLLLDNLIQNRAEVTRPWREYAALGDSVFLWQVAFAIVTTAVLGTLAAAFFLGHNLFEGLNFPLAGRVLWFAVSGTVLSLLAVAAVYIQFFMNRFVTIIMYRDRIGANEGWRRFLNIFKRDPASLILYGLYFLTVSILGGLFYFIMGTLTCCVGLFLLATPYINSVIALPLTVLLRYLDLEFLAQFEGGGGLLPPPLPVEGNGDEPQNSPEAKSTEVDGQGTVIRPEDVGQNSGRPQAGPQDL